MHDLENLFLERLVGGLRRKAVTTASKWAETYRIMPKGAWRFDRYPWLRDMHDSKAETNIGQKAAQMGYTETVLNLTFFNIDVKGNDCLYVLPSKTPDASDFSASRFDTALELSTHLSRMFSDVKNIGHKKAGSANLYVRGSQSRSGLKSIPVAFLVLDEVEEFNKESIPLAMERMSGQIEKMAWLISTPTIDNKGINEWFRRSTQEHFFFKCPSCRKSIELIFPDSIEIIGKDYSDPEIIKSFLKCTACGAKLPHETKKEWLADSEWVPQKSSPIRGFYINQLYSPTVRPSEIVSLYFRAMTNPADEQEFFNSKLGLPHAVEGARVTDEQIENSIKNYHITSSLKPNVVTTMGVDVGKFLHYEIDQWYLPEHLKTTDPNMEARCRVVRIGKLSHAADFDELLNLVLVNSVTACIIDANPERRKALEFAKKLYGLVRLCFYGRGIIGKTINIGKDINEPSISVDRTAWLDLSLGRFRNGTITLPIDTPLEYKDHIKALVRVYKTDKDGQQMGYYDKGENDPDHYAHARNYSEIALPLALSFGTSYNITKVL